MGNHRPMLGINPRDTHAGEALQGLPAGVVVTQGAVRKEGTWARPHGQDP